MNKRALAELFDHSYRTAGVKRTVILADRIKDMGYKFATQSGVSIAVSDMVIPSEKQSIIQKATENIREIERQYNEGLITDGEKYNKVVDIWAKATEDIAGEMMLRITSYNVCYTKLLRVSANPFLAPWVETKYCKTVRPSRKFAVMGRNNFV